MELLLDPVYNKNPSKMMNRATRYPTLIYIGLLLVICILSYKYWKLATFTYELKEQIYSHEEKVNQFTFDKSSLEKDKEVCLGRVKFFEDRIEQNQQVLTKKDAEINDLNQRFRDGQLALERYRVDYDPKLKSCEADRLVLDEYKRLNEVLTNAKADLELKLSAQQVPVQQTAGCDFTSIRANVRTEFNGLFEQVTDPVTKERVRLAYQNVMAYLNKTADGGQQQVGQQQQQQLQQVDQQVPKQNLDQHQPVVQQQQNQVGQQNQFNQAQPVVQQQGQQEAAAQDQQLNQQGGQQQQQQLQEQNVVQAQQQQQAGQQNQPEQQQQQNDVQGQRQVVLVQQGLNGLIDKIVANNPNPQDANQVNQAQANEQMNPREQREPQQLDNQAAQGQQAVQRGHAHDEEPVEAVVHHNQHQNQEQNAVLPHPDDAKDICNLPFDFGSCDATMERFYFDSVSKMCKTFQFSGCGGNLNNFHTLDTCVTTCVGKQGDVQNERDEAPIAVDARAVPVGDIGAHNLN